MKIGVHVRMSKKRKDLWQNSKITTNVNINNPVIKSVEQFTYLGCVVTVHERALQMQIKKQMGSL
jgi:hypothetical protein